MAQETLTPAEPGLHSVANPPSLSPDDASAAALARRVRELEALRRMAVATADAATPEEIFRLVCDTLAEVLAAEFVLVAGPLFETPREWCGAQEPPREAIARLIELMEEARTAGETLAAGRLDAPDAAGIRAVPPPFGAATALALPLPGDDVTGALVAGWNGARTIDADTLGLARVIGEQAAAAFRHAARYDALRVAAVRRERFFSAMSHDLRTPITAIMGYSELLQDGIMGELEPHQQEMVERICQVSGHLAELVNDVLDIAKLDAGRMEFHPEPVSLGELAEEALVAVEPQAAAKALQVHLDIGRDRQATVEIDLGRVRQILVNLLSNAVKFTGAGGTVTLSSGTEDGRRWIRVSDTGPGIPEGSEEAVFEEFMQIAAGSKAKREPGSGLGLAISRRLARAMGGELTARNGLPGGAVFTLYLPAV